MTDELDRLREELHAPEPRLIARAKGMNAAMQAFEDEFSESGTPDASATRQSAEKMTDVSASASGVARKTKKSSTSYQGSDAHRRLSGQNAPRGGARPRRRSMTSRVAKVGMMFSGTAVAAALAAFVVVPNIKGDFGSKRQGIGAEIQSDAAPLEIAARQEADKSKVRAALGDASNPKLQVVPAEFERLSETVVVEGASQDLQVVTATYKNVTQTAAAAPNPAPAIPGQPNGRANGLIDQPSSVRRVTVPGKTAKITTRVIDRPASVQRLAVPRKTATVQTRAVQSPADATAPDQETIYSVRRVAIPGKTATITKKVRQPDGSFKTVVQTFTPEEASESLQIVPSNSGAGVKAPKGYRLEVKPATYETYSDEVVVVENFDGTPLEKREVQRRRIVKPTVAIFVPIDAEAGLPDLPLSAGTPVQAKPSRDRFEAVEDYPTLRSAEEPVSTFSVDVDTASYSFMRASVNRGQLPNPASVRVEELINYFPYQYEAPSDAQEPFKANVTVTPTPWNADTKLMHIGIKGYTPTAAERPNSNIVLLTDTSGSMNNPNKLPLLINSFKLLLDTLGENDTVSIVTYAGSAGTVLEPTPANERSAILAAFDRLRAGGSTAGAAGLELAYNKAQENFDEDGVNRVILATDGDFNVGFSSPDEMKTYVEKKRESGVFLSVLGFGMGNYNDHLMQTLAQNGNGVAAYIDSLSEARKVLADEAGGALIPIAKDVKIQVEFNPAQISEYRLIGYETRALKREDFNNDKVDAGEIGSGHTVTAIYELTPKGSPAESVDDLRYAEAETIPATAADASDEYAFVKIRYKLPNEDVSTLISRPVGSLDETESLDSASTETRFAASVAAFGQMLRGGTRLESYNYDDLIALANGAKGDDEFGYRSEFINLVRLAKSLDSQR